MVEMEIAEVEIPLVGRFPSGRPKTAVTMMKPKPRDKSIFYQPTPEQLARPNDLREYAPPLKLPGIASPLTAQAYAVWAIPQSEYASSLLIDQAEGLVLQRLMQIPTYKRNPERPLVAVLNFFFEWANVDSIDRDLFVQLFPKLGLANTPLITEKSVEGLFLRMDLDRKGSFGVEEFAVRIFKPRGDAQGSTTAKSNRGIVLNALARMREGLLRTGGQESLHSALRQFIKEEREDLDKLGLHANLRSFFGGYGVTFTEEEVHLLFEFFAAQGGGKALYSHLCNIVRGTMSGPRLAMVQQAFSSMAGGRNYVTADDVYANYDGRMNYAVLMKDACPDDAVIWFLNSVDTAKQDILTRDEFCSAFEWTSASIALDTAFATMMRQAWPKAGL
jgi:hypothetical protein